MNQEHTPYPREHPHDPERYPARSDENRRRPHHPHLSAPGGYRDRGRQFRRSAYTHEGSKETHPSPRRPRRPGPHNPIQNLPERRQSVALKTSRVATQVPHLWPLASEILRESTLFRSTEHLGVSQFTEALGTRFFAAS